MRIGVAGSIMHHTERMIETRDILMSYGHKAFVTLMATPFIGQTDEDKEKIKIEQKTTMMLCANFGN